MEKEFEYLAKRAELFLDFLDYNKIDRIFPMREAERKDLQKRIESGSIRRMKILNNIIDHIIISSHLTKKQRETILKLYEEKLGEDKSHIINKNLALYKKIVDKGIIESNLQINDAIEIANSTCLGLSKKKKQELQEIINVSMLARFPIHTRIYKVDLPYLLYLFRDQ